MHPPICKKITLKETIRLIKSDLIRYKRTFWYAVLFEPGFKYTTHHRICYYLSQRRILYPLFICWMLYMKHLTYLLGIQMAWNFKLPPRFTIAHFGGITFFPDACGENIYLRQNCTVGAAHTYHGPHPRIGNNVVFGANVVVAGDIDIGDNVIIAAGAVVTRSVPPNCVVAGVPAKVVKHTDAPMH